LKLKKLYVISDIHGYFSIMKDAFDKAGFEADNEEHLLICLGDYFDRGNENLEVLKYFERLKNCVLLKGNHEDMLLKLLYTGKVEYHHRINGTINTLDNFFGKDVFDLSDNTLDFSGKTRTVDRICDFIYDKSDYFETENYVFVHGWIPSGCKSAEDLKNASDVQWEEARKSKWHLNYKGTPPLEGKTLVCGHVPTFYAGLVEPSWNENCTDIFYGNGLIAIDAGTHDTKKANVLVIEDDLL